MKLKNFLSYRAGLIKSKKLKKKKKDIAHSRMFFTTVYIVDFIICMREQHSVCILFVFGLTICFSSIS